MTTEEETGGERRFVGEFDVGSITGVIGENLCIAEEINVRVEIRVIGKKM
jgi:hypothetical protein